ncbi:hypothetical protein Taro_045279, partial [Colocasia esculenta]|nr:hypothetical protein [Colocasia esculenta]
MEILSASFVSSKSIRMLVTVIHAPIQKECVPCVGSKFLTQSFTNKAMYDVVRNLEFPQFPNHISYHQQTHSFTFLPALSFRPSRQ